METSLPDIVVIGGSAGALDALKELFEGSRPPTDVAYVVVLHPSPDYGTALETLISRWTELPVRAAEDGRQVRAGHVYVHVPGRALRLAGGTFVSDASQGLSTRHHPVDGILVSIAREGAAGAVAVILSGSGQDGREGCAALRPNGTRILVQNPPTCRQDGMPKSVIDAGLADEIVNPGEILHRVAGWRDARATEGADASEPALFDAILQLVGAHGRRDMRSYKPATLRRRIGRRADMVRARDLRDYLDLLRQSPAELDRLTNDMLIGVTAFFRDPEAFEILADDVIPVVCARHGPDEPVRVWLAGCSTGEEAYSIAILLLEWFAARHRTPRIQIFATDIDDAALEYARTGLYPKAAAEGLSAERLARYFVESKEGYRVAKRVRETIVFASHNLLSDPPFSRLDLVVCRNVLIYLGAETQKRLLNLFRFVLVPGGHLFLGSSESVGALEHCFEAVSKPFRIFRLLEGKAPPQPPQFPLNASTAVRRAVGAAAPLSDLGTHVGQERAYRQLIETFGPTLLLTDERFRIVYVSGDSRPYLTFPVGEPTQDIFEVVQPHLRTALRAAASRAQREQLKASVGVLPADEEDRRVASGIRITVSPVRTGPADFFYLFTLDSEAASGTTLPIAGGVDWPLRQLEQELDATREDLQRTIERMRTSSEEINAAHEEVMAMNEELQSANEELESSREELQTLNDELSSSNAALDAKVQELETINNDLGHLLLSNDTATLFLDAELRIRRFTAACTHLMRLIPTDIGRFVGDIAHNFADRELLVDCRTVLHGEGVEPREVELGDGRVFLRRILPYVAAGDEVAGVVLTFPDISAVKRNETELVRNAEQMRWQAELLREAPVLGRDLNDRIIFWTQGTQDMYGFTAEEVLGRVSHEVLSSRFELPLDQVLETLKREGAWTGRITHLRRDGTTIVVNSHWRIHRDAQGNAKSILEVNTDITDRVAAEAQVLSYRDHLEEMVAERTSDLATARHLAESATRSKSAFLANMSHEIRTPLNAIIGMAHLIRRKGVPFDQVARLDKIDRAGQHLLEIINAVLDISKIESGKVLIEERPFELASLLSDVATLFAEPARAKQLDLATEIAPDVPAALIGDATRIKQALINYVGNAVKFTDAGRITLGVSLDRGDDQGVHLRFEVRDTGIGIAPEVADRLFAAFEQADNSTTRSFGGTGLGLAITRRLAELMGGEAGLVSALGVGSTFWFSARLKPRDRPPGADSTPSASSLEDGLRDRCRGRQVLVVEDEAINREVIGHLLEDVGLVVDHAENGAEAVQRAGVNSYDLIFMDMQMPKLDGLTATRQIRALPGARQVPIIALTANAFIEDKAKCLEAGMNDFLGKPFEPDQLFTKLAQWLATAA